VSTYQVVSFQFPQARDGETPSVCRHIRIGQTRLERMGFDSRCVGELLALGAVSFSLTRETSDTDPNVYRVEIWSEANGWEETAPWTISREQAWAAVQGSNAPRVRVFRNGAVAWSRGELAAAA
jgi:hypothetical protein